VPVALSLGRLRLIAVALCAVGAAMPAGAALDSCRLSGVEHGALCGSLSRPLDPADPRSVRFELHFAVLPALARNKKPDPVFFLAGGPGQSAIELAGTVGRLLARLGNRRDIVLVDLRGTGRSAPLVCGEVPASAPLRESADPQQQIARLSQCLEALRRLPHGDLRLYTTALSSADVDAVRRSLGAAQINLVGVSYGTRLALDLLRQFPTTLRRVVLDGVAPSDMALPSASARDAQAVFDVALAACQAEPACDTRFARLRADWQRLLSSLPLDIEVRHPLTGQPERLRLTREMLLGLVRAPLYVPAFAAALPAAIDAAANGDFGALFGLSVAVSAGRAGAIAEGAHFSVVCSEDAPRAPTALPSTADFGEGLAPLYRAVCRDWPRAEVPAAFYAVPEAPVATLLLSGGLDPVTPPRHGQRVADALGAMARHEVAPNAGHGLLALGCIRDLVFHFIDAPSDAAALQLDAGCARAMPRPPAYLPIGPKAPP
jgi:pimeloyl-ACP methyl ester carboxylesterase